MNDPVVILKKDHREAEALLKQLATMKKPSARRTSVVQKLTRALPLHMEIEERLVYPVVRRVEGDEVAKEATIEHSLVREGVADLNKLSDKPGFGAAVAMLTAGIKHHVKEEEGDVFPKLKSKLSRDKLAELGDAVAAAHK